jgi:hypothetical protein
MKLDSPELAAALDRVAEHVETASTNIVEAAETDDYMAESIGRWHLNVAYVELLVVAEVLQLPLLRADIAAEYAKAQANPLEVERLEAETYAVAPRAARRIARALQETVAVEGERTVTRDIESILRAATYSITDTNLFAHPPKNESEVHDRVEGVLRCLFADLQRKPRLPKTIKNFEPDTGLPSLGTLIEFKFISESQQVPNVADQILADTRGYKSREWPHIVFAIYETERFRPEPEWRQALRDCGVRDASVVVMHGERPFKASRRLRKAKP